jgi:hypothetical protein
VWCTLARAAVRENSAVGARCRLQPLGETVSRSSSQVDQQTRIGRPGGVASGQWGSGPGRDHGTTRADRRESREEGGARGAAAPAGGRGAHLTAVSVAGT